MFGIGQTELLVVGLVVLILFGHRLPSVMFNLGDGFRRFKKGLNQEDAVELPVKVPESRG